MWLLVKIAIISSLIEGYRTFLQRLYETLVYIAEWCNGSTLDFASKDVGSIPTSATMGYIVPSVLERSASI